MSILHGGIEQRAEETATTQVAAYRAELHLRLGLTMDYSSIHQEHDLIYNFVIGTGNCASNRGIYFELAPAFAGIWKSNSSEVKIFISQS